MTPKSKLGPAAGAVAAPDLREHVVHEARSWLGTPYRHQASVRGAGCDCLGLLRGVWIGLYGEEAELPPPYTPDWSLPGADDLLLHGLRRNMIEIGTGTAVFGDILAFRMVTGAPCRHVAVVTGPDSIIHSYWGRAVVESRLVPWWRRRIAAAFSFPPVR